MVKHIYPKGTSHKEIEHYDVLILGAGPAGLTAAIYAGRYNLKTAVIAKSIGGTANLAGEIENWPGFIGPGMQLMQNFKNQAEKFGARFLEAEVTDIKKDSNGFVIHLGNREIHGRTLILALGTEYRKLKIPGEKEFLGKGVSYCATCDGNFFREKTVAVIGGADSAAKVAIYLSGICKKVYIVYRKNKMRCEPIVLKKIENKKNIQIYYNSNPTEIIGDKKVSALRIVQSKLRGDKEEITLNVDGVFVEIGSVPIIEIIKNIGLEVDKDGYIITNKFAETNISGCFAAGDSTDTPLRQVVTAAGAGAVAAKSAFDFLKKAE